MKQEQIIVAEVFALNPQYPSQSAIQQKVEQYLSHLLKREQPC